MKTNYRLLIVGNGYDGHVASVIKNLRSVNQEATIDLLTRKCGDMMSRDITESTNNIYEFVGNQTISFQAFRHLKNLINHRRYIKHCLAGRKYDIVVIHYLYGEYALYIDILRKAAKVLLTCPWGSDVLRTSKFIHRIQKIVTDKSDYVLCQNSQFGKKVRQVYSIPDAKAVTFGFAGSKIVDYLIDNRPRTTTAEGKMAMGISPETYVITCAYNSASAQNHDKILEAIYKAKEQLPSNLLALLPFAYGGGTAEYKQRLESMAEEYGIKTMFVEEYLPEDKLFMMRMATDMFVHVQNTDANNLTLKQYMYCDKKIINGSWLRYEDLNCYTPLPYFEVDSFEDLAGVIVKAYNAEEMTAPADWKENFNKYRASYGASRTNDFFCSCAEK